MKFTRSAAVAALALGLVLTGCSGSADKKASETKSETLTLPTEAVELQVWTFLPGNYDNGDKAYKEVFDAFTAKHPNITIKVNNLPYGQYWDQVRNATVAKKGPDVVTMYGAAQAYSYKNGLLPLQDLIKPEIKQDLKFVDENFSKDGNLYTLPTGAYGYTMLVNNKLLKANGLDSQTAFKDWDTMLATCDALGSKGIDVISTGWKDGYQMETFMYMLTSQAMDKGDLDKWVKGQTPMTEPVFTKALDRVLEMNKHKCFGDAKALSRPMYDDAKNLFYSGKSVAMITGSLASAERGAKEIGDASVIALPAAPEAKNKSMIDAGADAGWGVTKWTKQKAASVELVNFMASPEAQGLLWKSVNVPANLKSFKDEGSTPIAKQFLPLLAQPDNHTGFAAYPLPALSVMERDAAQVIEGKMSASDYLSNVNAAWEKATK